MSHVVRELIEAVLLALLVFFVIQVSVQNFRVEGHSMQPTMVGDEFLMVSKLPYATVDMQRLAGLIPFWDVEERNEKYLFFSHPPERGDVIVFDAPSSPEKDFVKRIVGLPGEFVEIKDGGVYIDGGRLSDSELGDAPLNISTDCTRNRNNCELQLHAEQYYVLGDNRGSSNDSRDWGPVPAKNIVGKVWFVYWPISNLPLPFIRESGEPN